MTNSDFIERLKYLVTDRKTRYQNSFPFNCGYFDGNGFLSFDCIGMVKSVINDPDIIFNRTYGRYAQPGKVIPDVSEIDILYLCTGIEWHKFQNIVPGEYLYMGGHGAVYVGDIFGAGSGVNVVECTCTDYWPAYGVVASWIDLSNGNRFDCKGGKMLGTWEAHGKLSRYIDYSVKHGWAKEGADWYYYDADGIRHRGWLYDPNYQGWFLLGDDGKMLTGWQKVGGKWYYLRKKSKDGLKVKGRMYRGWLKDKGKTYYLCMKNDGVHKEGEMLTGTQTIKGKKYTFDSSGALIS